MNFMGVQAAARGIDDLQVVRGIQKRPAPLVCEPCFHHFVAADGDASCRSTEARDRLDQDEGVLGAESAGESTPDVAEDDAGVGRRIRIRAARFPLIPDPAHEIAKGLFIRSRSRHDLIQPLLNPELAKRGGVLEAESQPGHVLHVFGADEPVDHQRVERLLSECRWIPRRCGSTKVRGEEHSGREDEDREQDQKTRRMSRHHASRYHLLPPSTPHRSITNPPRTPDMGGSG